MVGIPYVSWKALTKWSDDAFEAEYGECGSYFVCSVKSESSNSNGNNTTEGESPLPTPIKEMLLELALISVMH